MGLELSGSDRELLESWTRKGTCPSRVARRARIVLELANGSSVLATARSLGVGREQVSTWRDRFMAGGAKALETDLPRSGRPATMSASEEQEILRLTRTTTPGEDVATHWSTRLLAEHQGISQSRVSRLWRKNGIKPHLIRTFKLSKDPRFEEKLVDVIGLYCNPPEKALVLCMDEKSQIQAIDRTQKGLPMIKGRAGTMTHDYKRHGTTTLFAAMSMLDGSVIGSCKPKHAHDEFLEFLGEIDLKTPADLDLHIILDNYSPHKHPDVDVWLSAHTRFHLHFIPTSSSWLNLVERFFALITARRIRRGTFKSVKELERAIRQYLDAHNQTPKPLKWTASAESIINKVNRCRKISDSLH